MTKKITTVRVKLEGGEFMTCEGVLSKDGKKLKMKGGVFCSVAPGDEVSTKEVEIKKREAPRPCPFDMVNFFRVTKQL